jgi:hypothetical protein
MDIRIGVIFFHINLEHEGICFLWIWYHCYGHLVANCNYPSMKKNWALKKHPRGLEKLELATV